MWFDLKRAETDREVAGADQEVGRPERKRAEKLIKKWVDRSGKEPELIRKWVDQSEKELKLIRKSVAGAKKGWS